MSGYAQIVDGVVATFKLMFVWPMMFLPLGLWKLIEIIIWVFCHVSFGVTP